MFSCCSWRYSLILSPSGSFDSSSSSCWLGRSKFFLQNPSLYDLSDTYYWSFSSSISEGTCSRKAATFPFWINTPKPWSWSSTMARSVSSLLGRELALYLFHSVRTFTTGPAWSKIFFCKVWLPFEGWLALESRHWFGTEKSFNNAHFTVTKWNKEYTSWQNIVISIDCDIMHNSMYSWNSKLFFQNTNILKRHNEYRPPPPLHRIDASIFFSV